MYIGWGHKYSVDNFNPTVMPELQQEYPSDVEVTEVEDPSAEEELALRDAKIEKLENDELFHGEESTDSEDDEEK